MKRLCASILCVLLLLYVSASSSAYNGDVIVYVTNTGECYHRQNCSYLKSSKEITLEKAVESGYRPCSRCKPPKLGEDSSTDNDAYKAKSKSSSGSYKATPTQTPAPRIESSAETERSSTIPIITGLAGVGVGAAAVAVRKRKR